MRAFLLFLHFFGLMLGAAGGMASGFLMRRAAGMPPDQAQVIRGQGPFLANVAAAGVALLWVTGLIMVFAYWSVDALRWPFWVKLVFVVILTLATIAIHLTYSEIRRTGNVALGQRLAKIGPVSGLAAILAVLFASIAFL
ncbi:MAG TPA: hypothetical protein VFK86_03515 [Bauldia sp.]|nr:hypothetical protein [Bauldia sp.]